MTKLYQTLGASELLPRYLFLESLLARARILEVGAVGSTGGRSGAFLRERGARSVLCIDSDREAVSRAAREWASDADLRFAAGGLPDVAEAPFDLVLIADAAMVLDDRSALDALARLVRDEGHAVLALRNLAGPSLPQLVAEEREAPAATYGHLVAVLRERFPQVEIALQCALVGYRVAPETQEPDLDIAFDGSLADRDEAAYFLAICGRGPARLTSQQMVTVLPAAPLIAAGGRALELAERLRLARAAEREAREQALSARREREDLELRLAHLAEEVEMLRESNAELQARARLAEQRVALASSSGSGSGDAPEPSDEGAAGRRSGTGG